MRRTEEPHRPNAFRGALTAGAAVLVLGSTVLLAGRGVRAADSETAVGSAAIEAAALPGTRTGMLLPVDFPVGSSALAGLEATHAGDRTRAAELLTRAVESEPENPLGLLLRLKCRWWQILEGNDTSGQLERAFGADLERLRRVTEARLHHDASDVLALYALGEGYCTAARLEGVRGHAWATLRLHQKGTPLLESALRRRPELCEPLASLGVYHYYAARLPGYLRFLGKLVHVHGDRERGLRELRQAASSPGLQQAEAAFFLLEVLGSVEDENLEALPLAQRFHRRYPRSLAFTMKLGDVLVGLERPDLAVRLLAAAADSLPEPAARVQCRFFAARVRCDSGDAAEGLRQLQELGGADLARVTWIAPWHAYYLGVAQRQLGNEAEARQQLERARRLADVAGSRAAAERELSRPDVEAYRTWMAARAILDWDGDPAACREMVEGGAGRGGAAASETRAALDYALGVACLRLGDYPAAAAACERAARCRHGEAAWLPARSRARLLQALLWGGRLEGARQRAAGLSANLGEWGTNRQMRLLVQTSLETRGVPGWPGPGGAGTHVRFQFKDIGFTEVRFLVEGQRPEPMLLRGGYWALDTCLAPGRRRYTFLLEGEVRSTDPECDRVEERAGEIWSVRDVLPARSS